MQSVGNYPTLYYIDPDVRVKLEIRLQWVRKATTAERKKERAHTQIEWTQNENRASKTNNKNSPLIMLYGIPNAKVIDHKLHGNKTS